MAEETNVQEEQVTEEQAEQVETVPKDTMLKRINAKNDEIKDLQDQLKSYEKQLNDLKKAAKGNEDLENTIQQLQDDNKKWADKYQASLIDASIKLAAKDAKDPADVLAFINKEGLKLSDSGDVEGLEDALSKLRESKPYLFGADEPKSLKGREPVIKGDSTGGVTREDFMKMSYTDRVKLHNENPDLYKKLTN